jgi:hypothetical protein
VRPFPADAAAAAHAIGMDRERRDGPALPGLHGVQMIGRRRVCAAYGEARERAGLAPAPRDQAAFLRELGAFVRAPRIVALLDQRPANSAVDR